MASFKLLLTLEMIDDYKTPLQVEYYLKESIHPVLLRVSSSSLKKVSELGVFMDGSLSPPRSAEIVLVIRRLFDIRRHILR